MGQVNEKIVNIVYNPESIDNLAAAVVLESYYAGRSRVTDNSVSLSEISRDESDNVSVLILCGMCFENDALYTLYDMYKEDLYIFISDIYEIQCFSETGIGRKYTINGLRSSERSTVSLVYKFTKDSFNYEYDNGTVPAYVKLFDALQTNIYTDDLTYKDAKNALRKLVASKLTFTTAKNTFTSSFDIATLAEQGALLSSQDDYAINNAASLYGETWKLKTGYDYIDELPVLVVFSDESISNNLVGTISDKSSPVPSKDTITVTTPTEENQNQTTTDNDADNWDENHDLGQTRILGESTNQSESSDDLTFDYAAVITLNRMKGGAWQITIRKANMSNNKFNKLLTDNTTYKKLLENVNTLQAHYNAIGTTPEKQVFKALAADKLNAAITLYNTFVESFVSEYNNWSVTNTLKGITIATGTENISYGKLSQKQFINCLKAQIIG